MTEAELLFTEILNCDKASLLLKRNERLAANDSLRVSLALKRRISGEPLQYILGVTEFMGFEFRVNKNVLIPRPETELLVEKAVTYAAKSESQKVRNILDLGTGSGCIAISLAKLIPDSSITAVDICGEALLVAKENAILNKVADRIKFIKSDLFSSNELRDFSYELIISNPPYICTQEISALQPEVRFEPRIALDGGIDGLDFYRRLADKSALYLRKEGLLIMEMGFGQSDAIKNIFENCEDFKIMEIEEDYNNIERIMVLKRTK